MNDRDHYELKVNVYDNTPYFLPQFNGMNFYVLVKLVFGVNLDLKPSNIFINAAFYLGARIAESPSNGALYSNAPGLARYAKCRGPTRCFSCLVASATFTPTVSHIGTSRLRLSSSTLCHPLTTTPAATTHRVVSRTVR